MIGGVLMVSDGTREVVVPYIPGDGIGSEIMSATRMVLDAAVVAGTNRSVSLRWQLVLAGEESFKKAGQWLPESTIVAIRAAGVALKGPLSTPVGGGIRSLNVAIRQSLDLYASVRPIRYFEGAPSPVREPERMNIVIFRENTEDVYKGIEWKAGSEQARRVIQFLESSMGVTVRGDSGIGIKPISEFASKRLIRAAILHAIKKKLRSVTLVHKGNIMKFTEGAFREWGYEVARDEFPGKVVVEDQRSAVVDEGDGRLVLNDRIADNMFQQILTRPDKYAVLATPNLNGDYLADACAAQVGGLGLAPGANIGDRVAVFEAVHGTAPKYAGKNIANPCSLILSGAMMLEHLGLQNASDLVVRSIEKAIADGIVTKDLAHKTGSVGLGTKEFSSALIEAIS